MDLGGRRGLAIEVSEVWPLRSLRLGQWFERGIRGHVAPGPGHC